MKSQFFMSPNISTYQYQAYNCAENGEVESMIKFQHEIDPHLFVKNGSL